MLSIFGNIFFENPPERWGLFALSVLFSAVLGRIFYWFFKKIVRRLVVLTKSHFDDILVDTIESPVILGVVLLGIWYGLHLLHWNPDFGKKIYSAYYVLIIFNSTWLITRFFDAFTREFLAPLVQKTNSSLDDMLLPIVRRGLRLGVWLVSIAIAINNIGYDVGALLAGLGIGGLAFALAAQESLANLFGGLTIIADRPFSLGDWVRIDANVGQIKEIGLRSTRIRTVWDTEWIIPNSKLVGNQMENLSKSIGRRIELYIPIAYEHTADEVEKAVHLLGGIVLAHPNTLDDVSVMFRDFSNFAFNIRIRYFLIHGTSFSRTRTEINVRIMKTLEENGLRLAKPIAAFQRNGFERNQQG